MRVPSASTRGSRKQVSPSGRLRQHQEAVRHRRRAEPLVAGQLVRPVLGERLARRRVGAYVAAALLLRHAHPEQGARPSAAAGRSPGRRPWTSAGAPTRRRAPGRCAARAPPRGSSTAGSRCPPRPASTPGTRPRAAHARPGRAQAAVSPAETPLPSSRCQDGMEVDLVDPVAVAVVGAQLRRVLVRQHPPLLRLGRSGGPAERRQLARDLVEQLRRRACRSTASVRARSAAKTSYPTRGGGLVGHGVGGGCHADTLRTCSSKRNPEPPAHGPTPPGPRRSTGTSPSAGPPGCC